MKNKKLGITIWGVILLAIVGLIIALVIVNSNDDKTATDTPTGNVETPSVVDEYGTIKVTKEGIDNDAKNGRTDLYIYLDPLCPGCGVVDRTLAPTFEKLIEDEKINLNITPLAFLDQASTDDYSSRVISAAITIAEEEPEYFVPFLTETFNNQPAEGQDYLSVPNDKLIEMAKKVGVSDKVANSINDQKYKSWAIKNTEMVMNQEDVFPDGLSTPALFINLRDDNGKVVNNEQLSLVDTTDPLPEYITEQVENAEK